MKVNFVHEFHAVYIDIPGQSQINESGYIPLITYKCDPWKNFPTESETNKMVSDIQDWYKSVGLTKEPFCPKWTNPIRTQISDSFLKNTI